MKHCECGKPLAYESYEWCESCCEHEFDWEEGYKCLNCGKRGELDALEAEGEWRAEMAAEDARDTE